MESSSWPDNLPSTRIKAIQELTKGQILTNQLREWLDQPEKIESDSKSVNGVLEKIVKMFDNTISILTSSNPKEISYTPTNDTKSPNNKDDMKSIDSDESINNVKPVKTKRGCYKRRKNSSTITKVTSTLIDDEYAWRKYGQKVILNSKHQRNYYRCSHKFEQGCQATKQVQKTDDEPSKYKITYNGVHTCNTLQSGVPRIIVEPTNPMENSALISFERKPVLVEGACFTSTKHTPKEVISSIDCLKQEQVILSDHNTQWVSTGGLSQVPLEPIYMMSSGLGHEEMVSPRVYSFTTNGYEMDDIHDFGEYFVFE